jgi:glycosyltransferase involved in cell wall biosynthesis
LPDIIESTCVKAADGIIVVCDEQVSRLQLQYGFPGEHTAIVHNTPELDNFQGQVARNQRKITFAHHGYLQLQRNLEVFIQGFALARRQFPEIVLHLAGEGETLIDLQNIVRKQHLENSVRFTGEYRLSELSSLYSSSDIGIIPYIPDDFHNHTLQNKLFDYMACGKPVLVSKAKPLERIIAETGAGISWDCSTPESVCEGINFLLSSDITAMSENGVNWARNKYNWSVDEQILLNFMEKYC